MSWPAVRGYRLESINIPLNKGYVKKSRIPNFLKVGGSSIGGNSCNNAHSLAVKIVDDLDIPTLKIKYPTNQKELISLIDKTNTFLKDLKDSNPDDLGTDLIPKKDKASLLDVEKILKNLI
ncbi:DUF2112 family protein [uncultured Methanobrevibacter sp.]|uniref:DUF2112 family protein n=1 Tax=uncultured Methanobrevibacter sp. TaxID=253161 RepID=UPI0025F52021|nr:DUF2112 family protein [uncultured Methanobrevibacter sp.]